MSTLTKYKDFINEMARPFSIYLASIGLFACIWVKSASPDVVWALAGLAGGMGIARTFDKRKTNVDSNS